MTTPRRPRNYINNRDFFEALCDYLNKCSDAVEKKEPLPRIPDYIGQAFVLLCNRISSKPNFANYSYREEMIGDGIENCVMQIKSFNPQKSENPFAYFSQIIINAFIRRIKREKKQHYIKIKNMDNLMTSDELSYNVQVRNQTNEITHEYVRAFEKSMSKTKKIVEKKQLSNFIEK
jgi:DNA-directed RNA polymerase specialized sigma24 family protein